MNTKLKKLSETVARANDLFYSKFDHINTSMGIMDKTLRAQSMKSDAITIDCISRDKKIVFLIHADEHDVWGRESRRLIDLEKSPISLNYFFQY